jgi:ferredoxin
MEAGRGCAVNRGKIRGRDSIECTEFVARLPGEQMADQPTQHLRVTIDHELCQGTQNCDDIYESFFLVIDGKSHVRHRDDWSTVDWDLVRQAESRCPWFAIAVEEGDPATSGPIAPGEGAA